MPGLVIIGPVVWAVGELYTQTHTHTHTHTRTLLLYIYRCLTLFPQICVRSIPVVSKWHVIYIIGKMHG